MTSSVTCTGYILETELKQTFFTASFVMNRSFIRQMSEVTLVVQLLHQLLIVSCAEVGRIYFSPTLFVWTKMEGKVQGFVVVLFISFSTLTD